MLDLVFYSIVEVLSGLAPSYTVFLVLRALFGIGMGGEWGVGASLAMEKVPPRLRGVFSGLLQQGYAVGYLLAAVTYYLVFPRWGWRPLFFIGGLPALLALFVRSRVHESEVWEKTRLATWKQLGGAILSRKRLFLQLALFMTAMGFVSHGTQDMYPTFLRAPLGLRRADAHAVTAISMLGAIARRRADRPLLGPRGPQARDRALAARRDARRPAVGLRALRPAAGARRVPDPVLRPGRLGRRSRAHHGALPRLAARLPPGLRVPMRHPVRGQRHLHRGGALGAHVLRVGHGADRHLVFLSARCSRRTGHERRGIVYGKAP